MSLYMFCHVNCHHQILTDLPLLPMVFTVEFTAENIENVGLLLAFIKIDFEFKKKINQKLFRRRTPFSNIMIFCLFFFLL